MHPSLTILAALAALAAASAPALAQDPAQRRAVLEKAIAAAELEARIAELEARRRQIKLAQLRNELARLELEARGASPATPAPPPPSAPGELSSAQAQRALAEAAACLRSGELTRARVLSGRALEAGGSAALELYARALIAEERYGDARAVLVEEVNKEEPPRAGLLVQLALAEMGLGRLEAAARRAEAARELEEASPDARLAQARIAQAAGRRGEAYEHFRALVKLAPRSAEVQAYYGRYLQGNGDATGAIRAYTACLEIEPNNAAILANRGTCYRLLRRHDDSLADLKRAFTLRPKDGRIALQYAKVRWAWLRVERVPYTDKKWDPILILLRLADSGAELVAAQGRLGFLEKKRGNFEAAAGHYSRAIKSGGDSAEAHLWRGYRGMLYAEWGKPREAVADCELYLKKASSTSRNYQEVRRALGIAKEQLDRQGD